MQTAHRFGAVAVRAMSTFTKPPVAVIGMLKNGTRVEVVRPNETHRQALVSFAKRPGTMADTMKRPEEAHAVADDYLWNARSPKHDALVAVVGSDVVGVTEIDPDVHEMEPPKDESFLQACGMQPSEVCVAQTLVSPTWRNLGVGSVLKLGQAEAARNLGYRAVATCGGVQQIAPRVGGTMQAGEFGGWTLVPTDTQPKGKNS
ncbi:hypothetical protein JI739_09885 [Ramlibacter sp. AW1]|uniref:N-acetyltransferase domain-containing protein n=1 Tax=Ramlibacter aurantiacus TaxID=2801330 RepID=A0A937D670_9BURK|nr:hypothetical protein [Ramlibacter aurantiacus]MBL0420653.1 hypothetical protein [Ramlibacter aurantiacus]